MQKHEHMNHLINIQSIWGIKTGTLVLKGGCVRARVRLSVCL